MPRGRPPLSRGTKNRKKEFDERLSAYSLSALDNVIDIADKCMKCLLNSNQTIQQGVTREC